MLKFSGGLKYQLLPPLAGLVLVPPDLWLPYFVLSLHPHGLHECPGCMLPSSLMASSFQEL